MAKVGYFIITEAQAEVLDALRIPYETLNGRKCVKDWDAVTAQIEDIIWEDGEVSEVEGAWLDAIEEDVNYLYWSDEGHNWV